MYLYIRIDLFNYQFFSFWRDNALATLYIEETLQVRMLFWNLHPALVFGNHKVMTLPYKERRTVGKKLSAH